MDKVYRRDYAFKTILNSEGALGITVLRTLFKFDGTEKRERKRIARQHKLKEGEERKVL